MLRVAGGLREHGRAVRLGVCRAGVMPVRPCGLGAVFGGEGRDEVAWAARAWVGGRVAGAGWVLPWAGEGAELARRVMRAWEAAWRAECYVITLRCGGYGFRVAAAKAARRTGFMRGW